MRELKLSIEKAQQLGKILAAMCGIQNSIVESLQNGENVSMHTVNWLALKQKHMRHFLDYRRINVAKDEYYEGKLNAYMIALNLLK